MRTRYRKVSMLVVHCTAISHWPDVDIDAFILCAATDDMRVTIWLHCGNFCGNLVKVFLKT